MTDLASIQKLDAQLARCYEDLLAVVTRLHGSSRPSERAEGRRLTGFGVPPMVRFLVRRHIRRRLAELGGVYVQRQAVASSPAEATWYEDSVKRCAEVRASIPAQRLPTIAAIVTAVGFVPKALSDAKLVDLTDRLLLVLALGYVALGGLQVYVQFLRPSYRTKRRLLLGTEPGKALLWPPRSNVYEVEDNLFTELNRRKKPEFRLDYQLDISIAFVIVLALFLLPDAGDFDVPPGYWWGVGGSYLAAFAVGQFRRRREIQKSWQ